MEKGAEPDETRAVVYASQGMHSKLFGRALPYALIFAAGFSLHYLYTLMTARSTHVLHEVVDPTGTVACRIIEIAPRFSMYSPWEYKFTIVPVGYAGDLAGSHYFISNDSASIRDFEIRWVENSVRVQVPTYGELLGTVHKYPDAPPQTWSLVRK